MDSSLLAPRLLAWSARHPRPMPWKGEKDPYKVWVSEIILQQTRVAQGTNYYLRFIEALPSVEALAAAPEDRVLKLWEGLGYYSRARNLHAAAQYVVEDLQGRFPKDYEGLLSLKGVGPYTAAAIAAFAYDLPHAVLDGNVFRVLARLFGESTPIDTTAGKKRFARLAQDCLDDSQPARYNQAMLDFGALHCKPKNPSCSSCPFSDHCLAFREKRVEELPVKAKKLQKKERIFNYLLIEVKEQFFVHKRKGKDIWKGLYQFPLIESSEPLEWKALQKAVQSADWFPGGEVHLLDRSRTFRQQLTHQKIKAAFWTLKWKGPPSGEWPQQWEQVRPGKWDHYPFPKIINCYLSDNSLALKMFL